MKIEIDYKIILEIISRFGVMNQTYVAIEELSELQKELCKILRFDSGSTRENLNSELADCIIMIMQMIYIHSSIDEVNKEILYKLERTIERINDGC